MRNVSPREIEECSSSAAEQGTKLRAIWLQSLDCFPDTCLRTALDGGTHEFSMI